MADMIFEFDNKNASEAKKILAKYPKGREKSAVMSLLWLAQEQNGGWLNQQSMDYVANYIKVAPIRVYEVASFYTMYNLKPVGKFLIQVCTTTPCMLRGAESILNACKKYLGVELDEITIDKFFTIKEVECLGACVNAPIVQINNDYYEDLSVDKIQEILQILRDGNIPKMGSQIGRISSEPIESSKNKL